MRHTLVFVDKALFDRYDEGIFESDLNRVQVWTNFLLLVRLSNDPKPSFDTSIEKQLNSSGMVESDRRASRSFNGSHVFRRSTSAACHTKIVLRRVRPSKPLRVMHYTAGKFLNGSWRHVNRESSEKRFG